MKKLNQVLKEELDNSTYNLIDERSFNKILTNHYRDGFIIISNYRNENTKPENERNFITLKKMVRDAGYSFIPVYGGFIENAGTPDEVEVKEAGLLIPNHKLGTANPKENIDDLKNLGLELAKAFNQDSFLFKPAGEENKSYYITKNGDVDMEFSDKSVNDLTQIYFTKLQRGKNRADRRFTFTEKIYLNQPPLDLNEARNRYGEQFFKL